MLASWIGLVALVVPQQPDSTRPRPPRPDTVLLPPIEVVSSILPAAGPRIRSGIPARISRLAGRDIDAWEPRTLGDALGSRAGVSVYDDLGSPSKINLTTRGFSVGPVVGLPSGISVFLDGVRQNQPDAAQVDFDLLPLEHVKQVELLSGSGSLLGPNSLGGAINLITHRGGGPLGVDVEVAGGSFDSYSAETAVTGSAGSWGFYGAGGYERARGWRDATVARSYNLFANVGRLAAARGIAFQVFGAGSYAETAGSLPETIFATTPRANFTAGDFEDLQQVQAALTGYVPWGSATLFVRRHSAERFNVNQAPDPDVRGLSRVQTLGANFDWGRSGSDGAVRLGLDATTNAVHIRLFEATTLTTDVHSPSADVAAYAIGDVRMGSVTVSLGARYDYVRIPFENRLDPSRDTVSVFRQLSPRAGVDLALGGRGGASLYGSVGRAFRAPVVVELACADETAACPLPFALGDDPPLDPVVATTYEIGGGWSVGSIRLEGALYRTDVRDDISFIASDAAVFEGYFANIGGTRREGLEISAESRRSGALSWYVNYALTRATFRSSADIFSLRSDSAFASSPFFGDNAVQPGDRLPLVPAHRLNVGGTVGVGRYFEAGIDGRLTGRQWLRGDEANQTRRLREYLTASVRLSWERDGWNLAAIVTNLFNAKTAVFGTFNENRQTGDLERFLTPLEARAFKLIVRRGFMGSKSPVPFGP